MQLRISVVDPAKSEVLRADCTCGDHIHLNPSSLREEQSSFNPKPNMLRVSHAAWGTKDSGERGANSAAAGCAEHATQPDNEGDTNMGV